MCMKTRMRKEHRIDIRKKEEQDGFGKKNCPICVIHAIIQFWSKNYYFSFPKGNSIRGLVPHS